MFLRDWLIFGLEKSFQHDVGYFGREEHLARRNVFHSICELRREIGFQDVTTSPGFQDAANHLVGFMHG